MKAVAICTRDCQHMFTGTRMIRRTITPDPKYLAKLRIGEAGFPGSEGDERTDEEEVNDERVRDDVDGCMSR